MNGRLSAKSAAGNSVENGSEVGRCFDCDHCSTPTSPMCARKSSRQPTRVPTRRRRALSPGVRHISTRNGTYATKRCRAGLSAIRVTPTASSTGPATASSSRS